MQASVFWLVPVDSANLVFALTREKAGRPCDRPLVAKDNLQTLQTILMERG